MEKTDRELLIKEISSRLSYEIKVQVFGWDEEKGEVAVPLKVYSINTDGYISLEYNHYDVESVYIEDCLLYLRSMSSMTEEENKKLDEIWLKHTIEEGADYLNSIHVDYRGLIQKGLAIAVTEENNPYKD
jgi:hypothetical protein